MITIPNMLKLVALICIVGLGTVAALFYLTPLPTESETKEFSDVPTQASSSAQTRLFFNPSYLKLTTLQTQEVQLFVQTGENAINEAQFELKYNPTILTIISLRSGDFFPSPTVLLQEIDEVHGRIQFALSTGTDLAQIKGTGALAVISLAYNPEASGSSKALLEFMPKTAVRGQSERNSLLQSTENLVIEYEPKLPRL